MHALTAVLLMAAGGHGHVTLLSPKGGETLKGNTGHTITWEAEDEHDCVYNLYFSADSGRSWQTIALGLGQAVRSFEWIVPDRATGEGRVRVLQDNTAGTDPDSRSGVFTIQAAAAGIGGMPLAAKRISLGFRNGHPEVSLELARPAEVALEVRDARGALTAARYPGRYPAGRHRFFLPSGRASPPLAFLAIMVRIDGQVRVFHGAGGRLKQGQDETP